MKMKLYINLFKHLLLNKKVTALDYSKSYDECANSYSIWINEMGKYTRLIIPEVLENESILDLACGTGFISEEIVKRSTNVQIDAVDLSKGMLKIANSRGLSNVYFIHSDAMDYIQKSTKKYNRIFCGWALEYLPLKTILPMISEHLNENGTFHFIVNTKNTLDSIEQLILQVMEDQPKQVKKMMDLTNNLPKNKTTIERIVKTIDLNIELLEEVTHCVTKNTVEDLYDWLFESGALAGVNELFIDPKEVKPYILKYMDQYYKTKNGYTIHHRFIYGILKKGDSNVRL